MAWRRFGATALLVLGLAATGTAASGQAKPAPVSFNDAQADHGREVFQANCQACHGAGMAGGPGGPPLNNRMFRSRWRAQSPDALFNFLHQKMPPQAPGSLSNQDYAAVMAYVLKTNGAKSGMAPADPAALAGLTMDGVWPAEEPIKRSRPTNNLSSEPDPTAVAAIKRQADRLAKLAPITDALLRQPPPGDWLHWRRTYDAQGFSNLSQINRDNVGGLSVAWSWELTPGKNQITPLVHDGVLFAASAGTLQAIDAATGDLLWQYARPGVKEVMRNLAIYGDLIYLAADESMVAINMRDGKVAWERQVADPADGLTFRGGPLAAKGKIFQGIAGCAAPYPGGCFIVALDAKTGAEAWRFNTLARPGQLGGDSWNGAPLDQRTGGSVWTAGSFDPDLDLVYFGVGQTYRTALLLQGGTGKPGSNDALFTNSTLAFRPETGELVWHYQHMAREVWDLDWAFERTLATLTIDGKPRRTVTTGGKMALFDTLDAATGRYLFSNDAGVQNLVTGIDPKTGVKTIAPKFKPEPDVEKTVCPSASGGGRNWPATSLNPRTGVLFVATNETCMPFVWSPGGPMDIAVFPRPKLGSDGMIGRVQAIDLLTHKTLWVNRERSPHSSAMLATAGGVIFEGTRDRWFRASDERTGKVLWKIRLNAPPNAFPITYSVDGVQYVAVTAGGGSTYDGSSGSLTPEIKTPSSGTTLWVFRLPAAEAGGP